MVIFNKKQGADKFSQDIDNILNVKYDKLFYLINVGVINPDIAKF